MVTDNNRLYRIYTSYVLMPWIRKKFVREEKGWELVDNLGSCYLGNVNSGFQISIDTNPEEVVILEPDGTYNTFDISLGDEDWKKEARRFCEVIKKYFANYGEMLTPVISRLLKGENNIEIVTGAVRYFPKLDYRVFKNICIDWERRKTITPGIFYVPPKSFSFYNYVGYSNQDLETILFRINQYGAKWWLNFKYLETIDHGLLDGGKEYRNYHYILDKSYLPFLPLSGFKDNLIYKGYIECPLKDLPIKCLHLYDAKESIINLIKTSNGLLSLESNCKIDVYRNRNIENYYNFVTIPYLND